ncbi:MAG TPA: cytochrome c oxidase subunit II [Thermoanaerobaculia bacterium]|nr:cytochrome c oxidase subunit II [Thermoanaerobaculia bacterium]
MSGIPFFPYQASTVAGQVDALYFVWLAVSAVFSLLIAGMIVYFMVRFKRKSEDEHGREVHGNLMLEIAWSGIPLVICLAMFFWGTKVFFDVSRPPADAVEYFVTGKQWMWKIQHPSGAKEINDLHVPVGVPVKLTMTSEDVIHSFFLPSFRIKQDVLPGRYTSLWFEATRPGKYHIFCAEYCGAEHSRMGGSVYVMPKEEYEAWLSGGLAGKPPVVAGQELFSTMACSTCHMAGPASRGPELHGLFGSDVQLASGRTIKVDDAYLRESILTPTAKVVAGFEPLMPTYQGQLTEEQLNSLIAYIKSLPKLEGAAGQQAVAAPPATGGEG